MTLVDFIILGAIAVAFVAVCVRVRRRGTCADCVAGGAGCSGCSSKKSCPAAEGVDQVAERLGRNVR